jgi:hypothetical protein
VYGGELLRVFLAEVLVLKHRPDLSCFEPERSGPFCSGAAVAKLMPSRVDRLDFGVKLRGWHPTIVYRESGLPELADYFVGCVVLTVNTQTDQDRTQAGSAGGPDGTGKTPELPSCSFVTVVRRKFSNARGAFTRDATRIGA